MLQTRSSHSLISAFQPPPKTDQGNLLVIRDGAPQLCAASDARIDEWLSRFGDDRPAVDVLSVKGGASAMLSMSGRKSMNELLKFIFQLHNIKHIHLHSPWGWEHCTSVESHRKSNQSLNLARERIQSLASHLAHQVQVETVDIGSHLLESPPNETVLFVSCLDPRFRELYRETKRLLCGDNAYHLGLGGGSYALQYGCLAPFMKEQLTAIRKRGITKAVLCDHEDCKICPDPYRAMDFAARWMIRELGFTQVSTCQQILHEGRRTGLNFYQG